MKKLSISTKIYFILVIVLAISAAVSVLLPQSSFSTLSPGQNLPASKSIMALVNGAVMIILYGGLGLFGLKFSDKLGFSKIWDEKISNKQRFLIPALIGLLSAVILIVADIIFSKFNGIGLLPHPSFPTSIFASISAGIGEEIIFRLFFISFWVWLISSIILKNRWRNQIFWIINIVSALAFGLGHFPSLMMMFGFQNFSQVSPVLIAEIIFLNGLISLFAGYYFRKFGFLAAVGVHFWTDIVWHVIYGLIK